MAQRTSRPLRILIDGISARLGGGITVLRNLLPALTAVDDGAHEYFVVARSKVRSRLDPHHPRVHFIEYAVGDSLLRRLTKEQISLPREAARLRADVLFSPANIAVLAAGVPQVLMIQNAAPFDARVISRAPISKALRLHLLRDLGWASAQIATTVVFISEYARREIAPQLHLPEERTRVIYLGRDLAFSPEHRMEPERLRAEYGITGPYILTVSQFYHYKNYSELVLGFARALPRLPPETQLVICGEEHERDYAAEVRAMVAREGLGGRILFLGQVPYEKLPGLYASTRLFVFPSSCENFPNILVEGLSSGVPTLASKLGPMPEIAGDGAAYFDPFDPDDIAACILSHWHSPERASSLCARGLARVPSYSWSNTASALLSVFAEASSH